MKYNSVFDIIGPVMIGPSSSHTAGAARIGKAALDFFGKEPTWARIHLYGSFAKTYKGHGTDFALAGGLLGFDTDDKRMSKALDIAKEKGLEIEFIEDEASTEHPNTARLIIGNDTEQIEVVGISIGGGMMEITELNGFELRLSGSNPAVLIVHNDRFGAIAKVAQIFAANELNIGHMAVNRKEVGKEALMIIETDGKISETIMDEIRELDSVISVSQIN
ncbi:L-serine ammonia-lyase, iron-sulfur-dependent subunit beta [Aciduricibacillus chroicocephali]|uniref:L-serine deaminase n=1 Tax=Aciduricibacillus chroicocephali TaxID=3054939 RepID=A0ABY9KXZ1_9BACI|nr:L-serine ammonia-lyase, iron-sulfur-dependent subunit beta [Bacillaceae bacterium 44XB]